MTEFARQTGQFIAGLDATAQPASAREMARMAMTDCVGVLIAGAGEAAVDIVARTAADDPAGAPTIPSGRRLRPADAALVNGVAAHALDYDDVGLSGHPSAVIVPAVLAEGWVLNASGPQAITAYLAGFETWGMLESLDPGALHERGFHPTAIFGAVAAAAACAYLRRLDADHAAHAVAIAASLASGLVANFGTMTKPLHVGRAAQAGVLAAQLAGDGFTGSLDVFEHRSGYLHAHSSSGRPVTDGRDLRLGADWKAGASAINIKRYPTCYGTHRAIDAMLDLVAKHDLQPADVREIHVVTGETQMLMLRNAHPRTALEAKFSMQFALASALVARRVGLHELTDQFVTRSDVEAIFARVVCQTVPGSMPGLPFAPEDRVSVVLTDGTRLDCPPVQYAKGSYELPMTRDELAQKFVDCASRRLSAHGRRHLFSQLWELHETGSVRQLVLAQEGGSGRD